MILFDIAAGQVKQGEAAGKATAGVVGLEKDLRITQDMLRDQYKDYFTKDTMKMLDPPTPVQINDHVNKAGTPEQKKAWNNLKSFFGSIIKAGEGFWKG